MHTGAYADHFIGDGPAAWAANFRRLTHPVKFFKTFVAIVTFVIICRHKGIVFKLIHTVKKNI